jgi:hypothetical protein
MPLVIKKVESVEEKVLIEIPAGLGKVEKADIIVEFRRYSAEEVRAFQDLAEETKKRQLKLDVAVATNNAEVLEELEGDGFVPDDNDQRLFDDILNIRGLLDEDGSEVKFDKEEHLDFLLSEVYIRKAVSRAWMKAALGLTEKQLKAKNL